MSAKMSQFSRCSQLADAITPSDDSKYAKQRSSLCSKTHLIQNIAGATKEEQVKEIEAQMCCIGDQIAICVAKLAVKLENVFASSPRDIEFAVKGQDIYLLQVRMMCSLLIIFAKSK
jgi:hypothetical protein